MIDVVSLALISALTVLSAYLIFNSIKFYLDLIRKKAHILILPGRKLHPVMGHLAEFPGGHEDGIKWMMKTINENPAGISKTCFGPFFPGIAVFHPNTVKAILKTSEPKPRTFGPYKFMSSWLGDGLLISEGQKWARNRKLLTPAFHFDILKPYIKVNNQCADNFINKISVLMEKEEFTEVFTHISLMTLDIIMKCAFSYDINVQKLGERHPYAVAVEELNQDLYYRVMRPWLYPDWIFMNFTSKGRKFRRNCNYVHTVAEGIIKSRKQALQEHGDSLLRHNKYIDFLDILLTCRDSDGKGLTDLDIRNEVDTFLFEGHDTTASGISWTLYSLAEDPDIQDRCRKEIDLALGGRDSDEILWEDLAKLPYLTMCIKEGMRLHCPVPILQRKTTKDLDVDGYFVPADVLVDISLYALHHADIFWNEPYKYQPDRFSPENIEKIDPFAYVPFAAGPRNCIGQNFAMHEMKVAIARILRSFKLEIDPDRKARHEMMAVMKTESGMYMKFIPRTQTREM